MTLITRRQFVQEMAFAGAAICGCPVTSVDRVWAASALRNRRAALDPSVLRELASKIAGRIITPASPDYESARQVENRAYSRHPALIVRCTNASDVARTIDFSQVHSLPVAVRSGGHSAAGFGACDNGVVVDLSGMRRIEVDARERVARVEAGCLAGELDEATQRFGLA